MVEQGKAEAVNKQQCSLSSSAKLHTTEVLNQTRKAPGSPMKMALGGFAAVTALGTFFLYLHKKPEASAMDVAKFNHADVINPRFAFSDAVNSFFSIFPSIPPTATFPPFFKIVHM
ncbi:hypothetical protein PIB30_012994 [Stylosanthes scabra]|uniref:Uncharacterized protein n=1 Tax=Stylosanthes scabra TaxID=79078 RepID=A0ABU6Q704_9FABA|nr:hypothetical protein [Stylosanthes scabra]